MAKKKISGEVLPPDFDAAFRVYKNDIIPAAEAKKEAGSDETEAWKIVNDAYHVDKAGFKAAMKVCDMEDLKMQRYLRAFFTGLKLRGKGLYADLADQIQGHEPGMIDIPVVDTPRANVIVRH